MDDAAFIMLVYFLYYAAYFDFTPLVCRAFTPRAMPILMRCRRFCLDALPMLMPMPLILFAILP